MAAAAAPVTETAAAAAATATAAALYKAVGVTRCSCQVVCSRLPSEPAATRLSTTVKKELRDAGAGVAAERLIPPGTQVQQREGRGRLVVEVATRDLPGPSAEGAVPVAAAVPNPRRPRWLRRRAWARRLRGRGLLRALTGGRARGAPRFASLRVPGPGGQARR